ncbi:acyltransferase family protein [Stakelama sp. CBK3Z-3]|uniref:Acyltransferase family protein n=1 Tax=Stakelama flava TaxID=2860338 RepID=A0ABS6XN76_9SPHN|nr:acyltransferase family protein [Stakelama flava]
MERHYGMDWLRVGAFALLILYHIGMVFVPWNYHVKAPALVHWAVVPMLAVNAWRLSLLFLVSGFASRALLMRSKGLGDFTRNRSFRLLVPLLAGMMIVVPPQPWVELLTKHGYDGSYWHFWFADYFRFRELAGLALPTWNHLWFVFYLWAYTMVLTLAVALLRASWLQRVYDRVFGTVLVLALPLAWLVAVHALWFPMVGETHAFIGDDIAHVSYFPVFLFGFGLAGSPAAMRAIRRWGWLGAILALSGYAFIAWCEIHWPHGMAHWAVRPYLVAHAVQQWGAIVALIATADRFWNRNHPMRATLTEAVFPFYIVHQTIIVVAMWLLLGRGLNGGTQFAILVAATVAGCWAFYLIGREIRPLRPLVGLRLHRPKRPGATLAVR